MYEISETDNPPQPFVDKRIAQLQLAKKIFPDKQDSPSKIQKVPAFLRRDAEFAKHYSPNIISFGPIHHKDVNLKQGEGYKLLWTSMYIEDYCETNDQVITDQFAQNLLNEIQHNLGELKKLFTEDAIGETADEDLAWMLFVDGCSLLHFMKKIDKQNPEALKLKLDQMMHIWRDICMLENQLPRTLLELLSKDKGAGLESLMDNFFSMGGGGGRIQVEPENEPKPFHILDYYRRFLTSIPDDLSTHQGHDKENGNERELIVLWLTYKNIRDLKTAGIRVKASKSYWWKWSNISFTSKLFYGELMLPMVVFDNDAPYLFHNLIAYEMTPDFRNDLECCSYICFMDSLIDNGEDVKELRLAGVFQNLLGSDEEVAKLFNGLGRLLLTNIFNNTLTNDKVAYSKKYIQVKYKIEKHYKNKWRTGLAVVINTHFNNPWSAIAFFAAVVALVLTFIQTWFAVYPKKS